MNLNIFFEKSRLLPEFKNFIFHDFTEFTLKLNAALTTTTTLQTSTHHNLGADVYTRV